MNADVWREHVALINAKEAEKRAAIERLADDEESERLLNEQIQRDMDADVAATWDTP